MTDFLSSLLSRDTSPASGQSPEMGLRPRPVSLYENLAAVTQPDTPGEPSSLENRPATARPRSADDGALDWLSIWRSQLPALPEQTPTSAMAPELPLPPRNQTTEIIQSTASVFPVLSPVEPAAHQSPSLLIREIYQPLPSTVILPAPMPAVRQHEAEDAPRRPIPPPGVYEAPVRQPWHQSLDQPASDRGAIRPAERFAPPIPSSSPETAPAPVIHISIGRIEVHAAPQPAPAAGQRANRAEPVMALEEYLRRRNGGPA